MDGENPENGRLIIRFENIEQAAQEALPGPSNQRNSRPATPVEESMDIGQLSRRTTPKLEPPNGAPEGPRCLSSQVCLERQGEFFKAMNNMRLNNELCDATLNVDGHEIRAHKVVLAACSSFFHAMFTTPMNEAQTSKVELKDVRFEIVLAIVNFAYVAEISISDENVQELLSAANQYQIQPIKDACCEYLKLQLSAGNCLGIKDIADFHNCPELYHSALQFVDDHFLEVCQGDEFQQLSLSSVIELLGRDNLTVKCEDEVYDAAILWLKHDQANRLQHKEEVLSEVRFPLITRRYLTTQVQNEPIMQNCCQCLRFIISGMQHHLVGGESSTNDQVVNVRPRVKKQRFQIALFGGSEPSTCEYFDPSDHKWTCFKPMSEKRRDHTCARVGSHVYIIGGSYLFTVSRIDCYSVASQEWTVMNARLQNCRDSLAACTLGDLIYITGGTKSHGSQALKTAEVYDPKTDRLTELQPMSTPRFDHGMAECRSFIYVCGGATNPYHNDQPIRHCEKYNPATNKWTDIPPMGSARRGLGLAVHNNKIYALGGQSEAGALDSVECYDPVHCRWIYKAKMPYKLRTVKCAVIGDSIWVLAGYREMGRLSTALEYRPADNKWLFHYNTRSFAQCNSAITTVDTCAVE